MHRTDADKRKYNNPMHRPYSQISTYLSRVIRGVKEKAKEQPWKRLRGQGREVRSKGTPPSFCGSPKSSKPISWLYSELLGLTSGTEKLGGGQGGQAIHRAASCKQPAVWQLSAQGRLSFRTQLAFFSTRRGKNNTQSSDCQTAALVHCRM